MLQILLVLLSVFVREKVTINENATFTGFRIAPNWPYIGKLTITSQFTNITYRNFFLKKSLVPGPSFMSISLTGFTVLTIILYKGLTRNLEIRNNIAWALPSFWRLRKVNDTKFGTDGSNGILLNSAKCQDYSFSLFLSYPLLFKRNRLRETQQRGRGKITSSPPHSD